ncbi:MAG: serine/threonine-protein kinase [Nannocystaceae bacterium]|nr:serine/threonine-protein kinase [Nannocystaceae bacterium]
MNTADDPDVPRTPGTPQGDRLRSGAVVGRYRILEPLGRGGMSEVYAAYDPQRDRSVALKIMKHERGHEAHERLQREGRALARLGHRNVVVVHDVGIFQDELFVAMEHIKGAPLSRWMRAPERTWTEIAAAFVQAAAGLISAHAAGIVHRDFKPANVMVEQSGRVVVLDFGLARIQDSPTLGSEASVSGPPPSGSATHSAVGTLGYMAPELMEGSGASQATDQFAFCVSLYEALYGGRPFVGRHALELLEAIKAGPSSPAERRGVPRWLHDAVSRGLAPDPAERHPSMPALIEALERQGPERTGLRWTLGTALVATIGSIAWSVAGPAADTCATAGTDALRSAWNERQRTQTRDSMIASDRAHATETADRALARIDRFAQAWSETAVSSCRRRADSPSAQADAVQTCLQRGLDRLEVAVTTLQSAPESPAIADHALDLALSLPPVRRCLEEVALPFSSTPSADGAVSREIAHSVAARVTGSKADAARSAQAAVEASTDASPHVHVEALLERSRVHDASARYDDALNDAAAALALSLARELPRRQALASLEMVRLTGDRLRQTDEAKRWETLATASMERLWDEPLLEAKRAWVFGTVRWRAGELGPAAELLHAAAARFEELGHEDQLAGTLTELSMVLDERGDHLRARALLDRVLEIRRALYGAQHPAIADTLADMAVVEGRSARSTEALALGRQALEIYEHHVDPQHANVATIVMNMGLEYRSQGRHDKALDAFSRAESIRRQQFGDEHVLVADVLNNSAPCLTALGRYAEARINLMGTLKIVEDAHGRDSSELLSVLTNLGTLDVEQGNLEGALMHRTRAHEIALSKLGPDHPSVGIGAHNIGELWVQREKCAEAIPFFERALAIFETSQGPSAPEVAYPLTALGQCATEAGQPQDAARLLERALKLRTQNETAPADRGQTALALAAARHAQGAQNVEIWAAVDIALQAFDAAGQAGREQGAQARTWIEEELGPRPSSNTPGQGALD